MKFGIKDRQTETGDGSHTIVLDIDGLPLVITQHPNADEMPGIPTSQFLGIEHLGFGLEDFDAQVARLHKEGVEFFSESRMNEAPGERVAFVRAPDGVRLELTDAPWKWQQ
jgi:catechol 2,3-dioxygenase-like lactoylglutathione lyase family enzyme